MEQHKVDSDGIRIIKAGNCAKATTIDDAIEAMTHNTKYAPAHNKMLRGKLKLALSIRKGYEVSLRYRNRGW